MYVCDYTACKSFTNIIYYDRCKNILLLFNLVFSLPLGDKMYQFNWDVIVII